MFYTAKMVENCLDDKLKAKEEPFELIDKHKYIRKKQESILDI